MAQVLSSHCKRETTVRLSNTPFQKFDLIIANARALCSVPEGKGTGDGGTFPRYLMQLSLHFDLDMFNLRGHF